MYGNGDTRRKLYPGLRAFIFFPRADLSPLPTLLQIALPSIVSRVQQDWNKFENFHLFFTSANEILTIVVCGKQVFCFFFFSPPFVTKQLRSRLNWIHRWWRDWNWNNSNTTRIPLIPLGGNQKMESLETKYGSVLLSRIIDEREKKKSIPKEFVGGERENAAWNNTTMMKFPRKLINRDIRPFNSRVVSHLRIINYTMERWSIRESVQKVKFFFLPSIRSDRFQWWIERSNGTRSSFVKRLKSIRSNEFNLDSSLDESDSIWIWFVLLRKTFEWPFRILIPNDTRLL